MIGFASWEILHELAQFSIITAVLQEVLDLGIGVEEVGMAEEGRMGRLRQKTEGEKERRKSTCG